MRCGPLACGPLVSRWLMSRLSSTAAHFLRTHILRPTWHFVAAEDIRWILQVTAPRVQKLNQTIYRQHGLDPATLERGLAIIIEELEGGRYRTRAELGKALADRGLASQGIGLAYIVMNAELAGVICSGPIRGAQQTYALLDERVPRSDEQREKGRHPRARGEVLPGSRPGQHPRLGALVLADHRPVQRRSRCHQGPAGLHLSRGGGAVVRPRRTSAGPSAGRTTDAALRRVDVELSGDQLSAGRPDIHINQVRTCSSVRVIISETNVGLWRRTLRGRKMIMEVTVSAGVLPKSRDILEAAAADLATFLGKELELTITS